MAAILFILAIFVCVGLGMKIEELKKEVEDIKRFIHMPEPEKE